MYRIQDTVEYNTDCTATRNVSTRKNCFHSMSSSKTYWKLCTQSRREALVYNSACKLRASSQRTSADKATAPSAIESGPAEPNRAQVMRLCQRLESKVTLAQHSGEGEGDRLARLAFAWVPERMFARANSNWLATEHYVLMRVETVCVSVCVSVCLWVSLCLWVAVFLSVSVCVCVLGRVWEFVIGRYMANMHSAP